MFLFPVEKFTVMFSYEIQLMIITFDVELFSYSCTYAFLVW